jgi:hypothetical protein
MDAPIVWGSASLDEDSFVRSFESCEYGNERFKHADHIRLAWIYIRCFGLQTAQDRIATSIRRFAVRLGHEEKYHATMTRAWLYLVCAAHCATPAIDDFDKFISSHLWLADKRTLSAFYSETLLASDEARRHWVEPDLRQLPLVPPEKPGADPFSRHRAAETAEFKFKDVCGLNCEDLK